MSSELRVDKIIPTDGVPSGTYNAGGIIQMKQFFNTSFKQSSSSSDLDIITGTITPHFSTSKILIMVGVTPYGGNTSTLSARARIRRGGSSGTQIYYNRRMFFRDSNGAVKAMCGAMNVIDSPNTTSAVTYVFQTSVENASNSTIEFYSDGYAANAPENSMTLIEVSA